MKTRIAPSPTGRFHIGNARTALVNYILAKQGRGVFVLRIEDTDRERSQKKYEDDIIDSLTWLGLTWDEQYRQSERTSVYVSYLERLLQEGRAYYCPHTREETKGTVHFCEYREKAGKNSKLIRFKMPEKNEVSFHDVIRGDVAFQIKEIGDFSLAKNLEEPLYNFAAVVDDHELAITHVIRGEDHLSNTPKQILLQEALGFSRPLYAHLPIILGPDRTKLSKRHGAVAVSEFRKKGYLKETLINIMAFLGWNPGDEREFFTLAQLIEEFSLERVKKGGAIFDRQRLDFINHYYLKTLPLEQITAYTRPFIQERFGILPDEESLKAMVGLTRQRARTLEDLAEDIEYFIRAPHYEEDLLAWKGQSRLAVKEALEKSLQIVEKLPEALYNERTLEKAFFSAIGEGNDKGELLWPFRVALTGKSVSPDPFAVATLLGKKETLKRINHAIKKVS